MQLRRVPVRQVSQKAGDVILSPSDRFVPIRPQGLEELRVPGPDADSAEAR